MTNNKKEDVDRVDDYIYKILYEINSPEYGVTVREMTRIIWGYKEDEPTTNELFYNRAKLLERRIGAYRHRIFQRIRKDMKEAAKPEDVKRPKFTPYALPVGRYWKYLNAASYEQMPWVVKGLRHKADGLNFNAETLEAIF